jgi:hypothetical protein
MRYLINSQQQDFYTKHHYVGFDSLFSDEEIALICAHKDKHPRDLWRSGPQMKKLILRPQIAEIGAQLMKRKAMRIAYDQTSSFPPGHYSLEEMNALQNLSCALLVKLSDTKHPTSPILPTEKGTGIFFSPKLVLDWTAIGKAGDFLLIVYGQERMIYIMQPKDPYVHALKKEGYVFGDLLTDTTHPIVYR